MLPDMELDETLGLTSRLGDRIQGMHDLIGLDNRILSEAERLNPNGIGRIYDDQALPEEDDEFDELTANQRAIALLQHIKNNNPNLWKTIAELPDGIRSALPGRTDQSPGFNQPQPGQTIVMMTTEDSTRCYAVGDDLAPTPIRSRPIRCRRGVSPKHTSGAPASKHQPEGECRCGVVPGRPGPHTGPLR